MPHLLRRRLLFSPVAAAGEFSPLSIAGLIQWLDSSDVATLFQDTAAAAQVSASGDPVGRRSDKSGSGNHETQATGTSKPTYTTNAQNGRAGLSFDGGDNLDGANTYPSLPITMIGVARTSGTTGTNRGIASMYHSTNFGSRVQFGAGDTVTASVGTPVISRSSAATFGANTAVVYGYRVTATNIAVLTNGTISETTHTAAAVSNIISSGRLNVNSTANRLNGFCLERCTYNVGLSDTQWLQLAAYLNAKWAVY